MKNNILTFLIFFLFFMGSAQNRTDTLSSSLKITWVKKIKSDFSFTKNWEYPLGVEKKSDGKAGCADGGFCPERCYGMLDSTGLVLKDSAKIFYALLDTSHIPFSIECVASCGEFAGTNIIHSVRQKNGNIICFTETGIATHCSLEMIINETSCTPVVILNSIFKGNDEVYKLKSGKIMIDKNHFAKGILKAEFDFRFINPDPRGFEVWWKGKILSVIEDTP